MSTFNGTEKALILLAGRNSWDKSLLIMHWFIYEDFDYDLDCWNVRCLVCNSLIEVNDTFYSDLTQETMTKHGMKHLADNNLLAFV